MPTVIRGAVAMGNVTQPTEVEQGIRFLRRKCRLTWKRLDRLVRLIRFAVEREVHGCRMGILFGNWEHFWPIFRHVVRESRDPQYGPKRRLVNFRARQRKALLHNDLRNDFRSLIAGPMVCLCDFVKTSATRSRIVSYVWLWCRSTKGTVLPIDPL